MPFTDFVADLVATCHRATGALISDFEKDPTRSNLAAVASVAELAILGDDFPEAALVLQLFADRAALWLRSGLLEELCFMRADLACQSALLAYMAQTGAGHDPSDMLVLKRLCAGRLIGRSEIPVLSQRLLAAYLSRCGVETDFGESGERDLAAMVDKRLLRPRTDEHDLAISLTCAQLLRLEPGAPAARPSLFPQVLLAQAVRSENMNWTPVLAFLCGRWFSLDERLQTAAAECMISRLPSYGELLPPPKGSDCDSEYSGQTGHALRIRSTLALAHCLCTPGASHVN